MIDKHANRKIDVYKLRKRLGLTQSELADQLGSTARSVRRWENGKIPPTRPFVKQMRRLEAERFDDTAPTTPVTSAPGPKRRRLPEASEDGEQRQIGILPSSF